MSAENAKVAAHLRREKQAQLRALVRISQMLPSIIVLLVEVIKKKSMKKPILCLSGPHCTVVVSDFNASNSTE